MLLVYGPQQDSVRFARGRIVGGGQRFPIGRNGEWARDGEGALQLQISRAPLTHAVAAGKQKLAVGRPGETGCRGHSWGERKWPVDARSGLKAVNRDLRGGDASQAPAIGRQFEKNRRKNWQSRRCNGSSCVGVPQRKGVLSCIGAHGQKARIGREGDTNDVADVCFALPVAKRTPVRSRGVKSAGLGRSAKRQGSRAQVKKPR